MAYISKEYARDGTYCDHLTLQDAADLFNVEFIVISSLGPAATVIISPTDSLPLCSFHIGHFAEGDGEHYVGLQNDPIWQDNYSEETAAESDITPASNNNTAQELSCSLSETNNITAEAVAEHSHAQELINEVLVYDRDSTIRPPFPSPTSDLPLSEAPVNNTAALPHRSSFIGSADQAPVLKRDVLEHIIIQTLAMFPYMRQPLLAVSRFFREIVDKEPLPKIYLPEMNDIADIRHVSMRKIMLMKGKASGVVIRLREIINQVKWASSWLSLIASGLGWFSILRIYWKNQKK